MLLLQQWVQSFEVRIENKRDTYRITYNVDFAYSGILKNLVPG